jgi:hypothetical protein
LREAALGNLMIGECQGAGMAPPPQRARYFEGSDGCGEHVRIVTKNGTDVRRSFFLHEQWDQGRRVPEQQSVFLVLFPVAKQLVEHSRTRSGEGAREEILRKWLVATEANQSLRGKLLDSRLELGLIERQRGTGAFHDSSVNPARPVPHCLTALLV